MILNRLWLTACALCTIKSRFRINYWNGSAIASERTALALSQMVPTNTEAPNYQQTLESFANFDWSSIGATVERSDQYGAAVSLRFVRRSPSNKFQEIRLCCKNFLRTELPYQLALVMQQLQKFDTRILLDLKCHLYLLLEFVQFVSCSLLRILLRFASPC